MKASIAGRWPTEGVASAHGTALLIMLAAALGAPTPAKAQQPAPAPPAAVAGGNPVPPAFSTPRRPRIGLVLGGGGAKGFAHIGVIKDLEARHIPIDAIAGTSMGAVVGSMYAIGNDAAGIDRIAHGIDWQNVFNDGLQRRDLAFRRKTEDRQILLPFRLGLENGKPVVPQGVLGGQKLYATVQQLTAPWLATDDFNTLPIPFRAVAADIVTGRSVPLGTGSLSTAVFASMSIPAAFPPLERDGLLLVDGGIADNLPVDVARAMGVDVVIVVDVGEPPAPATKITNALAVFAQMQLLLGYDAIRRQRASLSGRDVLIEPDIAGLSVAGFDKLDLGIERGIEAARRQQGKLDALRVSDADWAAYLAERAARAHPAPVVIDHIIVDNDSKVPTRDIERMLDNAARKPFDGNVVAADVADIYALDAFERVDYRIDGGPGDRTLRLNARGSRSDRRYFQAGVILASDFGKTSTFDLGVGYTDRDFLGTGAEWRGFARVGNDLLFDVSLYRQWGRGFVEPTAFYSRASSLVQRVGSDDGTQTFQLARAGAGVDGGMVFGNWGELRAGVRIGGLDRSASSAGFSVPPGWNTDIDYRIGFTVDTLDSVAFPRDGLFATVQVIDHVGALGGAFRREQLLANVVKPMTRGRATLILGGRFGFTGGAIDEVPGDYRLGGFLNLSGVPRNALIGQQLLFGRAVGYYRISDQSPILDLPIYVGGSLEAGNVWTRRDDISLGSLRTAASGFVGLDSPLGPIFLAYGRSGSQGSVYLVIGRLF